MPRVVVSSLQSPTRWLRTPIVRMESAHIANCLKMIFRDPLASMRGVELGDFRESLAFATSPLGGDDDGHEWDGTMLDSTAEWILEQLRKRERLDAAIKMIENLHGEDVDVIRAAVDSQSVLTFEKLTEHAREWLSQQPTVIALREELIARIMDGRATVMRDRHTLEPSAPPLPHQADPSSER